MSTIHDVAAQAGVSIGTVSRALNGDPRVKPENLRRIQEAASALRYAPNPVARNLRKMRTGTWALIVGDVADPFSTQVTRGLEDVAQEEDISVFLCNSDEMPEKEQRYIRAARNLRVDGVVLTPTSADISVEDLTERGIPLVAVDRPLASSAKADAALVDSRKAAREAASAMIAAGGRRLACISNPSNSFNGVQRALGFREGNQEMGVAPLEDMIVYSDRRFEKGEKAVESILRAGRPDGLLIANGPLTLGIIEAFAAHGIFPGDDFAVTTFDDNPWIKKTHPKVSQISQPAYELGITAGRLLLDRINNKRSISQTVSLDATVAFAPPPH